MTIPILYEDDEFLAINKPPGVVVNRAESVKEATVQDWVQEYISDFKTKYPPLEKKEVLGEDYNSPENIKAEFNSRSGIVHRIDKETSGILLIAKTPETFFALKTQFMERSLKKTYQAIIHEKMPSQEGEIKAPIGRLPWNRERWGVVPDGKEAVTLYKVLQTFEKQIKKKKEVFQLIECFPKTGRTHQIRVHLKYINRPILGDYLYAGRKTARDDREWAPRVMLHAAKIVFAHPKTQEQMTIKAPLPEEILAILQS